MSAASPSEALDLLVVGALTVDHFPDGSAAPGGTVLHAARAAVAAGHQVGVVTMAGSEPDASAGLDELRAVAAWSSVQALAASVAFRHREHGDSRDLVLLARPAAALRLPPDTPPARAILFAPVADELDAAVFDSGHAERRGAILQGWLRDLHPGVPVTPLHLRDVPDDVRLALEQVDLVLASRDDLLAMAPEPAAQLAAVRAVLGTKPVVVVTAGSAGLWLSHGPRAVHVSAPRVVTGRATVGAGDMLAALMLAELSEGDPLAAAERAMEAVADALAARPPTETARAAGVDPPRPAG
ncbi:MAG TPA: PfkB family carbohydrate kinase [Candidatus Limnocylindria bacterium]|nr:PfkB family carbohydrate kinase [Candidatus Limnocylindria bacterium]